MENIKFRLLFESYYKFKLVHLDEYPLLIAWREYALQMHAAGKPFADMPVAEQATVFLRACRAAAEKTPALDQDVLTIMEAMPAAALMSEVFPLVATELKDIGKKLQQLVSDMEKQTERMAAFAAAKKLPSFSQRKAMETLWTLGFFQAPKFRYPVPPENICKLRAFLCDYSLDSPWDDAYGFCQSTAFFRKLSANIKLKDHDFQCRVIYAQSSLTITEDGKTQIASHPGLLYLCMLDAIGDADPANWVLSHPTDYHPVARQLLYERLLEDAKEAYAETKNEVEFCKRELTYLEKVFSFAKAVDHSKFGFGAVLRNTGRYITVKYLDGQERRAKFPDTVLNGRLTARDEDFQKRLFFSRDTLQCRELYMERNARAAAQLAEFAKGVPTLKRLLEMKSVYPDYGWLRPRIEKRCGKCEV